MFWGCISSFVIGLSDLFIAFLFCCYSLSQDRTFRRTLVCRTHCCSPSVHRSNRHGADANDIKGGRKRGEPERRTPSADKHYAQLQAAHSPLYIDGMAIWAEQERRALYLSLSGGLHVWIFVRLIATCSSIAIYTHPELAQKNASMHATSSETSSRRRELCTVESMTIVQ